MKSSKKYNISKPLFFLIFSFVSPLNSLSASEPGDISIYTAEINQDQIDTCSSKPNECFLFHQESPFASNLDLNAKISKERSLAIEITLPEEALSRLNKLSLKDNPINLVITSGKEIVTAPQLKAKLFTNKMLLTFNNSDDFEKAVNQLVK